MKFAESSRKVVLPAIVERAERDIEAVNKWQDDLKGVSVGIQMIHAGQSGSYADHVYSARIFCYQPNSGLTNGPMLRTITEKQAKDIARIFVHHFDDDPKNWASPTLVACRPEANPCGMEEPKPSIYYNDEIRSACWYVQINIAYTG